MIRKYHDRESVIAAYETLRRSVNCTIVRAYDAYSHKIGSHKCEEGQIYIEPQGFCVLAGVGKEVDGHVIPYVKGQKEYNVEVIMG